MKIGAIIWEMSKLEEPAALWQKGDGGLVSESVSQCPRWDGDISALVGDLVLYRNNNTCVLHIPQENSGRVLR